jgi:hypothetical protein
VGSYSVTKHMDVEISINRRQLHLSPRDVALAQAAASRDRLNKQFQMHLTQHAAVSYTPDPVLRISPNALKLMVQKYSEQLVHEPLEEMAFWFNYSSGVFLEPGYPPLYYSAKSGQKNVEPNKSAIGAIGEGVAGLLGQNLFHARKLVRPIQDYPDILMAEGQAIYLVEAKATTISAERIQQVIDEELGRLCVYIAGAANLLPQKRVIGVLVGTALVAQNHYAAYVTEVNL